MLSNSEIMESLNPCKYCRNKNFIVTRYQEIDRDMTWFVVVCKKCEKDEHDKLKYYTNYRSRITKFEIKEHDIGKCIAAWNEINIEAKPSE